MATQTQEVIDNRTKIIECAETMDLTIMNTMFQKQNHKLITYKEDKAHQGGPPYTRSTYETLDYILTPNRWKHFIKTVERDMECNINTDHYPLRTRIIITLKSK